MGVDFITAPIEVEFDQPPTFARRPHCPDAIVWKKQRWHVDEMLLEWRPANAPRLTSRLQRLGVARIFFRVKVSADGQPTPRVFDIYFDPTVKRDASRGAWFLSRELYDA